MSNHPDRERLHAEIDANLRKAYQQSLNEKLPKRFIDLIDKLRSGDVEDPSDQASSGARDQ
jgi:hypothetical protein